jgi:hypothetical protein
LQEREYEVTWQEEPAVKGIEPSWHATNRSQGFRTYFTQEGIRVVPRTESAPSWRWGLSLVGHGKGGTSWVVPRASLAPSGHRIEYRRGAFVESYENTPEGLEQVFILPAAPGIPEPGAGPVRLTEPTSPLRQRPVTQEAADNHTSQTSHDGDPIHGREEERERWVHVDMALWGDLSPRISEDGQAIDFVTPSGAPVLHYAQLKVTDARGEILPAWMEGFSGENLRGIRIVVDARNATYPVTIDPLATTPAWTAESNQASAQVGFSVATAGDVNGDGYADVIAGAMFYDNGHSNEGGAFVYLGSASGPGLSPAWTAESDQASAQFGRSVAPAGDVNADGYADVIVGASAFDNGQNSEGRAFVYLGSASGLGLSPAWTAESDQASSLFGYSVATAGDVNGDGYADVIVGARNYSNGQATEGGAFVYLGSAAGLELSPAWTAGSDQAGGNFGNSVATAGDVNGDGYADVIVGAWFYDNGEGDEGRAYVFLGSATGLGASPAWTAESDQASANFGISVATAGDVNGDGYSDVIVGADLYDNVESDEGRAFVYLGSATGLGASPAWTAESDQASANFGILAATAGDVNGDGYADVIVGAWLFDSGQVDEGRAFVYLGSATGLGASPAWTAESDQASANFGISVATAGDVNGDGYSDVIVGAQLYDNGQLNEGRVFVYLGSAAGPTATPGWVTDGSEVVFAYGISVATAGDVNGDGYSDVIVGASEADNGEVDEGQAFVYLGSSVGLSLTPAWMADGNQNDAYFGFSVATAGDVNGDGYSDVIVGAWFYDNNGNMDEGRAFVYLGSPAGLSLTPAWAAGSNQSSSHFGHSVASAGDVNGDGLGDVIVGAHTYTNTFTNEGRAYVYLGTGSGVSPTPAWTADGARPDASLGFSVATAGDVNHDGYSDIIVGDHTYSNGETSEGRAMVYLGSPSGVASVPAWTTESNLANARFGQSVATAGDVNGDGYADVIVGAPANSVEAANSYVYVGSSSGPAPTPSWSAFGGFGTLFGYSVATAGDVNGDGFADVIVGAPFYPGFPNDDGWAFVYLGSASGLALTATWSSESGTDSSHGGSVASAGDVNGDGYADILVGAVDRGRTSLFYGNGGPGLSVIPRQARTDGTTPISLLGKSDSGTDFRLRERGVTPAGRGKVRLQWEVKPLGTSFNGTGLGASSLADTGLPGASGSSVSFNEAIAGLSTGAVYRWRSRIVSPDPFFPRSPWMSLAGNNVTEMKLRTAAASSCIDNDGDGYGDPPHPSCPNPLPDCNDQNSAAWGTPGVVTNPTFTTPTTLVWGPPAAPGALLSSLVYDTLASSDPDDFLSLSTICIESNDGSDTMATVSATPPVGQVYYYLTRAENACPSGSGPLGFDSAGNPRQGRTCP